MDASEHGGGREAQSFVDRLRLHTRGLHRRAERSGVVREIIAGRVSAAAYALYLRNLLPAYRALEDGLAARAAEPGVGAVAVPALRRAAAIEADLAALAGGTWAATLALLPAGARYGARIAGLGAGATGGDAARLVAHAYVRYLGDLNGGVILRARLAAAGIGPAGLAFHAFPQIADLAAFRGQYRAAFDRAAALTDGDALLDEAVIAFQLNVDVSDAVQAAAAAPAA